MTQLNATLRQRCKRELEGRPIPGLQQFIPRLTVAKSQFHLLLVPVPVPDGLQVVTCARQVRLQGLDDRLPIGLKEKDVSLPHRISVAHWKFFTGVLFFDTNTMHQSRYLAICEPREHVSSEEHGTVVRRLQTLPPTAYVCLEPRGGAVLPRDHAVVCVLSARPARRIQTVPHGRLAPRLGISKLCSKSASACLASTHLRKLIVYQIRHHCLQSRIVLCYPPELLPIGFPRAEDGAVRDPEGDSAVWLVPFVHTRHRSTKVLAA